jgi:hypothetical protein
MSNPASIVENGYPEKTTDLSPDTDKLDHIMLYWVHLVWAEFELTTLVVIGTDCRCSCKSCSNKVYSIQHYMIKFVSVWRQVSSFLRVPIFNNTSVILWRSVSLVEEISVPWENNYNPRLVLIGWSSTWRLLLSFSYNLFKWPWHALRSLIDLFFFATFSNLFFYYFR